MLKIQNDSDRLIELTIEGTFKAEDFDEVEIKANDLIEQYGSIRLLINASELTGWENIESAKRHFVFVKGHQRKVERLAAITRHQWQHGLIALLKKFVHPDLKAFNKDQLEEARAWLQS